MLELRPYQKEISSRAVKILEEHNMVYLAMECRTGKSFTALETAVKAGYEKVLIVTKNKAKVGFEEDYSHYTTRLQASFITFGSLHKVKGEFDAYIIDEAHSIGAFPKPSNRAKALKGLIGDKPIIFLSATPTPESFSQIYHQLYISNSSPWSHYSNFYSWARDYVDVTQRIISGRPKNDYSKAKEEMVSEFFDKIKLDFTQKQSGFDVSIREEFLYSPITKAQFALINKLKKDKIFVGKGGGVVIADTAVKLQQKVHQICSGTIKLDDGKRVVINDAKAQIIKNKFKGKKVAIFYKFIAELEMLKNTFGDDGWTTDPKEFQDSTDKAYFGQFISSREGVRLDTADAIVFINIDFSFLSYAQARERIISKERTKEAVLYWVFSIDGIESKIFKAVKKKQNYTVKHFKSDYVCG